KGFSRTVFVLDGLLLLVFLCGSRLSFRLLRSLLPVQRPVDGRRVLIYGAGDGGELLLRELHNNPTLRCVPVGFADDDPMKAGKVIHGLRVFGGNGSFGMILRGQQVEEVVISTSRIPDERVKEVLRLCEEAGVTLRRMCIRLEVLGGPVGSGC